MNLQTTDQNQREALMGVADQLNVTFRLLGLAPFPTQRVELEHWTIVPAQEDNCLIPARAVRRVHAIFKAGIKLKGFLIIHEKPIIPPALPDPNVIDAQFVELPKPRVNLPVGAILETSLKTTAEVSKLLLGALALAASTALPMLFVLGAALVDPILVAVTDQNEWVEIDRWDE